MWILLNLIPLQNRLVTKHALLCGTIGNNRRLRYVDVLTLIRLSLSFLDHSNRTRFITEAATHHFDGQVLILVLIINIHLVDGALLGIDAIVRLNFVIAVLNVIYRSIV